MRVTTNNVPRFVIDSSGLSEKERADHDYLDWAAIDAGTDSASFVRYRGHAYYLGEFMRTESGGELAEAGWDGFASESAFSAIVIRLSDDGETAVVGRYCA